MPARGGVTSALLVHSGWTGVDDIFSGENNFFLANAPHGDLNALIDRLGERFEIMRTSIKKWTVGTPIQAPLDALEAILKRRPLAPDQVREIVVRMDPRTSVVNDREMPDVNIQHMLAIMLVDRTATFAAAHDKKRMQDPLILRQGESTSRAQLGQPLLTLTLSDGSSITENPTAVRGTAENPMTRGEVVEKARDLMQPILGVSATTRLIERLLDFENIRNVRELRPLVQRA